MKLWYMRDNHTFRRLPLDVEQALVAVREECAVGWTYGMLCSNSGKPPTPGIDLNAHGRATFDEFEPRARAWLTEQLTYKSPGDLEFESWSTP